MAAVSSSSNDDPYKIRETRPVRDTRFLEIIRQQLGENGLTVAVNQSFVYLLVLVITIAVIVAVLEQTFERHDGVNIKLPSPAIVNVKNR